MAGEATTSEPTASDDAPDGTDSPPSLAEATASLTAPGQMFEMETLTIRSVPTRTWKHAPPPRCAPSSRHRPVTGTPPSSSTRTSG